ncbi:MAG: hypothetical protein IJR47_02940, partial [Clostridia bacterium]|nr:hypothetical protein [Clostridia bacterium]
MKRFFMFCTVMASIFMFSGVAFAAEIIQSKDNPEYSVYWAEPEEEHEGDVMPRKTIAPDPTYGSVGTINQQVRSVVAAGALPAKYDLRSAGFVTSVKNQGSRGVCWTFSAMSSLESYLKKKIGSNYDFSEMHLDYAQATFCTNGSKFSEGTTNTTAIYRNAGSGGNVDMSAPYLIENGPVNESVMPYTAYSGVVSLNSVRNVAKTGIWVRDYAVYPSSDTVAHRNVIKQHIYNYGAIDAVMSTTSFYNSTKAYYNSSNTANSADHAITIVGWDDNYSASNFTPSKPSINGAWIIKNSWGTNTGESGYFYMSYADKSLYQVNAGILDASNTRNFDKMYSLNPLGQNSNLSYGTGTVYAKNVFSGSKAGEKLTSVTVGFSNASSYEIYVDKTGTATKVANMEKVATGSFGYEGYKTIDLSTPVSLTGNKFAVVVKYTSSGKAYLPMEVKDSNFYRNASANSGESYVSSSGVSWTEISTSNYNYANCSIKAFTKTGNSATFTGITAPATVSLGQSFNVKANMTGTTSGVRYKFVWSLGGSWASGEWGTAQGLSENNNVNMSFTKPGTYYIYVDVNYPGGYTETKSATVVVTAPSVSITAPSSANAGTSFNVKANVSGNTSGVQYKFVWSLGGSWASGDWGTAQGMSANNNVNISLAKPGTYYIYVDVKYPSGYVLTKTATVNVVAPAITGITMPSSVKAGTPFNVKANMSGNAASVQYKFVWSLNGSWTAGNWGTWRGPDASDNVNMSFAKSGTYYI